MQPKHTLVAAIIASVILFGLFLWSSTGCTDADYEPLFVMVKLPQLQVVPQQRREPSAWTVTGGDPRKKYDGTLQQCLALLPFTPVYLKPPKGYSLRSATIYREGSGANESTQLILAFEGSFGREMKLFQPERFIDSIPSTGYGTIKNYSDKPPVVGDDWTLAMNLSVAGFPEGSGVHAWLSGPTWTRPPTYDEVKLMIESAAVLTDAREAPAR